MNLFKNVSFICAMLISCSAFAMESDNNQKRKADEQLTHESKKSRTTRVVTLISKDLQEIEVDVSTGFQSPTIKAMYEELTNEEKQNKPVINFREFDHKTLSYIVKLLKKIQFTPTVKIDELKSILPTNRLELFELLKGVHFMDLGSLIDQVAYLYIQKVFADRNKVIADNIEDWELEYFLDGQISTELFTTCKKALQRLVKEKNQQTAEHNIKNIIPFKEDLKKNNPELYAKLYPAKKEVIEEPIETTQEVAIEPLNETTTREETNQADDQSSETSLIEEETDTAINATQVPAQYMLYVPASQQNNDEPSVSSELPKQDSSNCSIQ